MRSLLAPIACAFVAMSVDAQVVDLKGVVSNSSGAPVANAVVSLAGLGLKETTASDGSYAIVKQPSGVASRSAIPSGARFVGRSLVVSLASPATVSLDIFDVQGTLLQSTTLPHAQVGIVRLNLSEAVAKAPLLLGRLRVGSMATSFRALAMGGAAIMQNERSIQGGAARTAAAVDTLKVVASGYVSKSVALESYAQTRDVVLDAVATCNLADKTPDPTTVNVPLGGSPLTGSHQVVIETDPTLSGRTIYRPKDLGADKKYPILVWGNGACARDGTGTPDFYAEIASHGYILINEGAPSGTGSYDMGAGLDVLGGYLVKNFEWAMQQNGKPCSRFYQSLDTSRIGAFGWSCGGVMAYGASLDPRIDATIIMNSGLLSPDQTVLDKIHAPIAYICGGSEDIAYNNGKRDYTNMKVQPTIFGNVAVGHGGTYWADNGGEYAKLAVAWFNWWLKDDKGATGRAKFTDANCAFCQSPWTMETKRLP